MDILYTTTVTSTSGRGGTVTSDDGLLDLKLSAPKEMGGAGTGTNPEQLFAAGYSACFNSAVQATARQKSVSPGNYTITAKVALGKAGDVDYRLGVELIGSFPELNRAQAEDLMKTAHQMCPYSKATRGNIDVTLTVND